VDEHPGTQPAVAVPGAVEAPAAAPVPEPAPVPPAGMQGEAGLLFRLVRDQRVAFLIVGGMNTVIGMGWFILFDRTIGQHLGYMTALVAAHVASVLCAFVLYRRFVFRVRGHVLRDLWRFEVVNLFALGVNLVSLPFAVEVLGLPPILAQLVVTVATMVISFFGHRGFSFRRPATHPAGHPG